MPNYATAAGQVRLLISDLDETRQILTDDHIAGYLGRWGLEPTDGVANRGAISRAAADALDAIATSEALVSKVIRTQAGTSTDGAKVADALRKQAATLRAQADTDEGGSDGAFDVIEFSPYPGSHGGW
ncbi:hypothetical protein [Cellulomonas rhizosphaerae]|uniref:Uncharacterized protein n=1 Tax=Cellulomonas rhizosphaerae TaxID=2293719 RepID=A0A413RJG9_9CELL|nr:hypothetical protein [Cellulomonas rhizosphaerae]RHA38735.1 hypothetical protein D1825_13460 [Cellulomonas rhizosphaerae]